MGLILVAKITTVQNPPNPTGNIKYTRGGFCSQLMSVSSGFGHRTSCLGVLNFFPFGYKCKSVTLTSQQLWRF
jgi:hypothetical protein